MPRQCRAGQIRAGRVKASFADVLGEYESQTRAQRKAHILKIITETRLLKTKNTDANDNLSPAPQRELDRPRFREVEPDECTVAAIADDRIEISLKSWGFEPRIVRLNWLLAQQLASDLRRVVEETRVVTDV